MHIFPAVSSPLPRCLSFAFCCREPLSKLFKTRFLLVHHIFQHSFGSNSFRNASYQIDFFAPSCNLCRLNKIVQHYSCSHQSLERSFFLISTDQCPVAEWDPQPRSPESQPPSSVQDLGSSWRNARRASFGENEWGGDEPQVRRKRPRTQIFRSQLRHADTNGIVTSLRYVANDEDCNFGVSSETFETASLYVSECRDSVCL